MKVKNTMTDNGETYTNATNTFFVVQTALLVMFYGFNISLPWWVLWFPITFLIASVLAIIAVFIITKLINN